MKARHRVSLFSAILADYNVIDALPDEAWLCLNIVKKLRSIRIIDTIEHNHSPCCQNSCVDPCCVTYEHLDGLQI